jgi:hypothetical protein
MSLNETKNPASLLLRNGVSYSFDFSFYGLLKKTYIIKLSIKNEKSNNISDFCYFCFESVVSIAKPVMASTRNSICWGMSDAPFQFLPFFKKRNMWSTGREN